ncbi:MEDS domain-containing protein [Nonomuraea sp. N2-4H]|uniref:MEDS domain-containing protein n=1 Tax=Nonomuraea sp. N2-4H TaxID=3128898 RepID=UPI0032442999
MRHVAVPYDSEESFVTLTVPRVRSALDEGRQVLVVTGAAKLGLLAAALGPDAARIDSRSPAAWYAHPYRMLAACHDYTRGRSTLVIAEPSWTGMSERDIRELIRCDSVINAALHRAAAIVMCPYDVRRAPEPVVAYGPVIHPALLGADGEVTSTRFVPRTTWCSTATTHPCPRPRPTPRGSASPAAS